jgi:ribonuclease HII
MPTAGTTTARATRSAPVLRKALKRSAPSLDVERQLWTAGHDVVVGMDEVGRGAWAGPLTLGAAIVPKDKRVNKIRDSKMLTEREREALFDRVADWCVDWSVGHASEEECDELGMSEAQRLAARRALDALSVPADRVLLDGKWDFVAEGTSQMLVKGDARCLSIAAASILAKVTRDRIMRAEAEHHPYWAFELNKGYPCPKHKTALQGVGPSAIHRRSWVFMDHLSWGGLPRLVPPPPIDPAVRYQQRLF